MKTIKETINILTKNNKVNPFDKDEFLSCFKTLVYEYDILSHMRETFELLRTSMNQSIGVHHVTSKELMNTINTMNNTFEDGVGVEQSFIRGMIGESNDMSAFIISPFRNSELWVIQIHDGFGDLDKLGAHAMNCVSVHENLDTGEKYLVGVIVIGSISNNGVFNQVLFHEATHYLLEYTRTFVDSLLIDKIDRIENYTEFLADYLQFLSFKTDNIDLGMIYYHQYESEHFSDRVIKKYKPFTDLLEADRIEQKKTKPCTTCTC